MHHTHQGHHAHSHHSESHHQLPATVSFATLHCLVGCSLGEFAGLFIGVSFGLPVPAIFILSTTLAFITGLGLAVIPLMRRMNLGAAAALKVIWLGEAVSIAVMELAMNLTDYHMGGMTAQSVWSWSFWGGFLLALHAGFIAAWPVNYWMIKAKLKKCH